MVSQPPSLSSSLSKSIHSSPDQSTPPQSLKRSLSDLDFFTPSATSFNPRPYVPRANLPTTSKPTKSKAPYSHFTRNLTRNLDPVAVPLSMDPSPDDPNVIFLHPPFTNFPGAEENNITHLTYNLMAENPEWFLDPADFVTTDGPSIPDATTYPSSLEPPRGWCPAKKREVKDLGSEAWPEGDEPRLRCTFCRRNYAGVNAKSMWRRHVFEKHKIAMANRRDTTDRVRGRNPASEYSYG
jgi:hypothetical protein